MQLKLKYMCELELEYMKTATSQTRAWHDKELMLTVALTVAVSRAVGQVSIENGVFSISVRSHRF